MFLCSWLAPAVSSAASRVAADLSFKSEQQVGSLLADVMKVTAMYLLPWQPAQVFMGLLVLLPQTAYWLIGTRRGLQSHTVQGRTKGRWLESV